MCLRRPQWVWHSPILHTMATIRPFRLLRPLLTNRLRLRQGLAPSPSLKPTRVSGRAWAVHSRKCPPALALCPKQTRLPRLRNELPSWALVALRPSIRALAVLLEHRSSTNNGLRRPPPLSRVRLPVLHVGGVSHAVQQFIRRPYLVKDAVIHSHRARQPFPVPMEPCAKPYMSVSRSIHLQ